MTDVSLSVKCSTREASDILNWLSDGTIKFGVKDFRYELPVWNLNLLDTLQCERYFLDLRSVIPDFFIRELALLRFNVCYC